MPSAVTVPRPCPEPRRECQSLGERASRQRIDSERSDVAASLCRAAIYLRLQPIVTRKVARQPQEVRYRDHQPGRSYHDQGPQLRRATSLLSSLRRDKGLCVCWVYKRQGAKGLPMPGGGARSGWAPAAGAASLGGTFRCNSGGNRTVSFPKPLESKPGYGSSLQGELIRRELSFGSQPAVCWQPGSGLILST